ncbi:MAG: hypothetical protein M3550_01795 [Actinomycetota bacterium]|nr:hypothetical protein [Actinomycetota bacterium]
MTELVDTYAMLCGARAALSERDVYAKTHRGAWHEFRRVFVVSAEFDRQLAAAAHNVRGGAPQA